LFGTDYFFAGKTPTTPTIKSPTKRQRDKDLLSDDDEVIVELEEVGGRSVCKEKKVSTGGFYVDRLGDHKVAVAPVFPQVKVSASYRDSFAERGEAIENPRIKVNFNRAVAKRIELGTAAKPKTVLTFARSVITLPIKTRPRETCSSSFMGRATVARQRWR